MSAARPPTSTKQLAQKAAVTDNPNTHSVQIWAKSALSLFEKGEQERQAGDLEGAYIHLFRAISIVGEVIPATNEWQKIKRHREDTGFLAAKRKVPIYLPLMEELKAELKKRFETWQAEQSSPGIVPNGQSQIRRGSSTSSIASNNTAREPRTSISPQELLGLFQQQIKTILVLDVRPMEQFIHGHIKWRIAPGPLAGGVVNLEPEWLDNPSRTIDDIESYLTSFGQSSAIAKTLFDARNKFDMIIFLDDHSTNPDSSPLLRTLMRVLYQSQSKSPRLRPLLLAGGHGAWESYINSIGEFLGDWVEIGEGCGRHIGGGQNLPTSYDSKVSNGSNGSGIARSAYDFVASRSQPSHTSGYIQKPLPTQQPDQLLRRPDYEPHNPFSNITNMPLSTSSPPLVPVPQRPQYYQAPSFGQAESRFSDPFFASSPSYVPSVPTDISTKRMAVHGNVFAPGSGLRNVTPSYPVLNQTRPNPTPTSSSMYPRPLPSPPIQSQPASQPYPPSLPQNTGYMNQNHTNQLVPSNSYAPPMPVKSSSPVLSRRPPLELDMAPPAIIRRSSSPSGSPSTARFYGMPPPLPAKPPSRRDDSMPGNNLYSHGTSGDFISNSQWSGSLMGMAGIKNLGNTCFMASIIQCLIGTVPLARYFLDGSYRRHINRRNPLGTKGEVADSFAELAKTMWTGQDSNVITPTKFKQVIGAHHPSFRGNEQQDSQEFLAFLLDSLHEDLNVARTPAAVADKTVEKEIDEEGIPDEILLEKTWLKYRKLNWSIIVDLFQGSLKSRLECMTCGKTSTTFNPFMYLTLPIPTHNQMGKKGGPVYIQECLDKFVEEEILDGDDAWRCPRCKVPRRTTKRLTIARLPVILLVHLKRFYFSGPFRDRVDTYVEFPLLQLDLTKYVPRSQEPFMYDLYAVSNHFGGLNGGHYTAQVRNSYKGNQWFNFDDSRISPNDDKAVKSSAAYILFYMRQMNGSRTKDNWWGNGARI